MRYDRLRSDLLNCRRKRGALKMVLVVGVDIHDATNISFGKIKDLKCFSVAHGPPAKLRNGGWSLISAGRDLAAQMSIGWP
ncbi:MAG: hypothetical protein E5X60_03480 [Mesorhizobium sp.]|nr:MAG: hypothetical protein E5X60_03480 [Mesorhizobium sp.]